MKAITLRNLKPDFLTKQGFYKWACESLGLISPGDSRKTALEIFAILWEEGAATSDHIAERLQKDKKHILYHLKRMQERLVVEKTDGRYHLRPIDDILEDYQRWLNYTWDRIRRGFQKAKTL